MVGNFRCPSPDGYYRDPESCSNFFHCIDGKAMTRKCDPNNYFDPQASVCRWDKLVTDCDDSGRPVARDRCEWVGMELGRGVEECWMGGGGTGGWGLGQAVD